MTLFRCFRLVLSAGALALAATLTASVSAPEAWAEPPCESWTGRLCGKTEVCTGDDYMKRCISYFYYFGTATME